MRDKLTLIEKVHLLKRYCVVSEDGSKTCADIGCRNCNFKNYEYPDCKMANIITILNHCGYDVVRKE